MILTLSLCGRYFISMEKDLQKKVVNYIRSLGLTVYSNNPPDFKRMTYGTLNQLPDLTIVNFNAYIELKDHKYTKAHAERQEKQKKRRKELTKAGAKAYKADTFEKVVKIIEFLSNKKPCTGRACNGVEFS